jgi:hypothetical protein
MAPASRALFCLGFAARPPERRPDTRNVWGSIKVNSHMSAAGPCAHANQSQTHTFRRARWKVSWPIDSRKMLIYHAPTCTRFTYTLNFFKLYMVGGSLCVAAAQAYFPRVQNYPDARKLNHNPLCNFQSLLTG